MTDASDEKKHNAVRELLKRFLMERGGTEPLYTFSQCAGDIMETLGYLSPDELETRDNATADAALDRAARAVHGEVLSANESGKIIFRSDGHNEWTPEGDYGMGRSHATAAILALKSTPQAQREAMAKISSEEKRLELE